MAKEKVTCVISRNGAELKRITDSREVHVNEHGQRYVLGDDRLRYRLNDFNEYEYRYGAQWFAPET